MAQSNLLRLPGELINQILSSLDASDIVAFGRTGRKAAAHITRTNLTLWRQAFRNSYDNPHDRWNALTATTRATIVNVEENYDWYGELACRRMLANLVMNEEPIPLKDDYTKAVQVLLSIVDTAKAQLTNHEVRQGLQPQLDDRRSRNLMELERLSSGPVHNLERIIHSQQAELLAKEENRFHFVRRSTRASIAVPDQPPDFARLHILYGLTSLEQSAPRLRGLARRLVYDWSLTSSQTDFGPFKLDGSGEVNWQLLEGVCSTILRNFRRCANGRISAPTTLPFAIPYRTISTSNTPLEDWAGVTSPWLGTYAFLDYADLYTFNTGHRPGQRPNLENEEEACGDLMRLELKLDSKLQHDWRLQTSLPWCTDLPVLYFSGESQGYDGNWRPSIGVRGCVGLVKGGREVRWRYLIHYGGIDQWQLEGVQAGGIRSGGVYGLWSHCEHAENGPVGPFCYFPADLCNSIDATGSQLHLASDDTGSADDEPPGH